MPARRTVISTALAIAAVTGIAACGDDNNDATTASAPATTAPAATTTAAADAGAASTVKLSADPGGALAFDTDTLTAKAGKVTLDMANPADAGIPHAIAIEGQGVDEDGQVAEPGGSSQVTATLKPGKYTFYCPVPGHRAGGMQGTLTVS